MRVRVRVRGMGTVKRPPLNRGNTESSLRSLGGKSQRSSDDGASGVFGDDDRMSTQLDEEDEEEDGEEAGAAPWLSDRSWFDLVRVCTCVVWPVFSITRCMQLHSTSHVAGQGGVGTACMCVYMRMRLCALCPTCLCAVCLLSGWGLFVLVRLWYVS